MSHVYHDALPGFDERQVLHDGCHECEARGKDLHSALAHMDLPTFKRAWRRAFDWKASKGGGYEVTGDLSRCELPLLDALWGIQVKLEYAGYKLDGNLPSRDHA